MEHFEDRIVWGGCTPEGSELNYQQGLSGNFSIAWDAKMLHRFSSKLYSSDICANQEIKWDIDLLAGLPDFWDYPDAYL